MSQAQQDLPRAFATALNPAAMFGHWQQGAGRVLRAQQSVIRGMMAATEIELRYGQEFVAGRMNLMKWDGEEPSVPAAQMSLELEKMVCAAREMTAALRNGITEAVECLSAGAAETVNEIAAAAEHVAEEAADHTGEAVETLHKAAARRAPKSPPGGREAEF